MDLVRAFTRVRDALPLLVVPLAQVAFAQDLGGIRGVVTDREFTVPLPSVAVRVQDTDDKTETDGTGHFSISGIPPGQHTVIFSKSGFERLTLSDVVVTAGVMKRLEVALPGDFVEMETFEVRPLKLTGGTEAAVLEFRLQEDSIVDGVGKELMSKLGAGDAAEAVSLVSGVSVQGGKFAVIRGLSDRFVSTQMNGIALPTADPDVRAVQLDLFPSALIETIRVHKTFMPDLPADTSGGLVDIITRKVPMEPVVEFSLGTSFNSQATGIGDFLTSNNGGIDYFGLEEGTREKILENGDVNDVDTQPRGDAWFAGPPTPDDEANYRLLDEQTRMFDTNIGTSRGNTPWNHGWGLTYGDRLELDDDGTGAIGWLATATYKNSYSYYEGGEDKFKVAANNFSGFVIPVESGEKDDNPDPDQWYVDEGTETVRWGLGTLVGFESEDNALSLSYITTRKVTDTAKILYDTTTNTTRSWLNQSVIYTERTLDSLQLQGDHTLKLAPEDKTWFVQWQNPEIHWALSQNRAMQNEPDRRYFFAAFSKNSGRWGAPPRLPNFVSRSWRDTEEDNFYRQFDITLPFYVNDDPEQEGEFKLGWAKNDTDRTYEQDTFYYDNVDELPVVTSHTNYTSGSFEKLWSDVFLEPGRLGYPPPYGSGDPFDANDLIENEVNWVIQEFDRDVDYRGEMMTQGKYVMAELPLTSWFKVIGGARWETTRLTTDVSAADGNDDGVEVLNVAVNPATPGFQSAGAMNDSIEYLFAGGNVPTRDEVAKGLAIDVEGNEAFLDEVIANQAVTLDQLGNAEIDSPRDVLPALGFVVGPFYDTKLRLNWSRTIARPTFKEITPVAQQDNLLGQEFAGNPTLTLSRLNNYDARIEWMKDGSVLSLGAFYKDIEDPIDYAQRPAAGSTPYIIPFNFTHGTVKGIEFEARQNLGQCATWLDQAGNHGGILGFLQHADMEKWAKHLGPFSLGMNFTVLDAKVDVPERDVRKISELLTLRGLDPDDYDVEQRRMKNQPDFLFNLYLMYDNEDSGTSVALFFNRKGETLIAGEDANGNDYIANLVAKPVDTVNLSISQKVWDRWTVSFKVENLLNPNIDEVWQSDYIDEEAIATSYNEGITYSLSLKGKW